jgi:CHASE3 domain sensor protein
MPTKRTIITLVAGLGLLAVAALSTWHTAGQLQKNYGLVAQSHQVRASLTRLLAAVQDVQMGKRGYVIAGDQRFLVPYTFGVQQTEFHFNRLLQLTKDNASHQERLTALKPLLEQKLAHAREMIALRETAGFEAAQREVASGKGQAMTDTIRLAIQDIDQAEGTVLVQRSKSAAKAADINNFAVILGSSLSFIFLALAAFLLLRGGRAVAAAPAKIDQPLFAAPQAVSPERNAAPERTPNTQLQRAPAPSAKSELPPVRQKQKEDRSAVAPQSDKGGSQTRIEVRPAPGASRPSPAAPKVSPAVPERKVAPAAASPVPAGTAFTSRKPQTKTGTTTFERRPPSLTSVIEQAVNTLQPAAALQQINLGQQFAPNLPEVPFEANKVTEILNNLLTNALKHTSFGGSILVTCGQLTPDAVHVSVIDNGVGIAPEYWERIFEPHDANGTTGLHTCREILKARGGEIWVQSEVGKGSTFTFSLPLQPATAASATATPPVVAAAPAGDATPAATIDPASAAEIEEAIQQLPWNTNKAA